MVRMAAPENIGSRQIAATKAWASDRGHYRAALFQQMGERAAQRGTY